MKPMTEAQAWRAIARAWDHPECVDGEYYAQPVKDHGGGFGVCPCIEDLRVQGAITFARADAMRNRLPERKHGLFCWVNTRVGARSRAAFCRRMAVLASRAAPERGR